ncbi:hypothetical protein EVAR_17801_1 [Eumeta japonica]|uniref:Uncharacterized protein n=1 Tax=Eumeta variegata TaxID=151549 RepID=A0A4C1TTG3_EUMVA|nr:hypothetical protein EVAR_17801_1 [Eumeta japonica]
MSRSVQKYIDTVTKSEKVYQIFSSKRSKYFNALKLILKTEPKIYFEILEQYCDSPRSNHRLSPKATKHIMQKHKDKYWAKPELYGGALLHLPTLARYLSGGEVSDLVLRLARAQYLAPWFALTYKSAEPLLKRINKKERTILVKQIFKDKSFGDLIYIAPYPLPKILR